MLFDFFRRKKVVEEKAPEPFVEETIVVDEGAVEFLEPEPEETDFVERLTKGLARTRSKFVSTLRGFEGEILHDEGIDKLEALLVEADLGIRISDRLVSEIRNKFLGRQLIQKELTDFLEQSIKSIICSGDISSSELTKPLHVILVAGVNGAGKTTTIGKLAYQYHKKGHSVIIAAADTFRAAAIEQLEVWGKRVGVDVIKSTIGADAAACVFDAIKAAKARGRDILIVDTAGRLHTKFNLMEELKKIHRIIGREIPGAPHETLLVIDAVTGQNGLSQAKTFREAFPVTDLVLTKLDGTAKGGIVVSIREETGLPVKYIGVGEKIYDLQVFDPDRFAAALFEE
ncbi:MAG: signal recognition particle-docking protein FtsY [Candidatus Wallbacteria bacterium]|nr:signal recognition particle-docking protein FtsY [Candidatus Wallbacteria bacterium]